MDTTEKLRVESEDEDVGEEFFYEVSPEERVRRFIERIPIVGQPFPYNSEVCELPPEMMFMHDVIYSDNEKIENVDVWDQMKKEVVPELERVWEIVKDLQARVKTLEAKQDELERLPGMAPAAGTSCVVEATGQGQA
jgi:hypothetical protein